MTTSEASGSVRQSAGMPVPSFLSRNRWPGLVFAILAIVACDGRSSGVAGSGTSSGTSNGGASAGTVNGASGWGSVVMSGTTSGAVTSSGAAMNSGSLSSGVVGASGSVMSSGTPISSGTVGVLPPLGDGGQEGGSTIGPVPSAGCGKALTVATGMWVSEPTGCTQGATVGGNQQGSAQCQTIPPGATVPAMAASGTPERRGWWVYVPLGYDPSKPYRVVYKGAGCYDPNWFHAGIDGYPYENVDNGDAILVGLDYDTYSDLPGCYDDRSATSNDFTFFPWLQRQIENEFCVDTNHEFFSGYSSGAWLAQQLNCAFPYKLRGFSSYSGCEPGAAGYPGSQPTCVQRPTAALYVKDFNDDDNTYACILPACARVLKQNGCTTTTCDPLNKTLTTPYGVPPGVNLPAGASCVQFNGCPTDYPVVFCLTYGQIQNDGQNWGIVLLLWDWMSNKLLN